MEERDFAARFNRVAGWISLALMGGVIIWYLLLPAGICIFETSDPALKGSGIPKIAQRLFLDLSPKYEKWARQRIKDAAGAKVDREDISGTEWPVFGSFFYLLALESLQKEWEKDHTLFHEPPKIYARQTIEAATAMILDPSHGEWVRKHWGKDYLTKENAFYRMLQIGAITTYTKLTDDQSKLPKLERITDLLAQEIDSSKHGLLDDYPNQCYPSDVLTAIAMIKRSGELTGKDYSAFVKRSIRGFEGRLLDNLGLPPYGALSSTGDIFEIARGCGNSYVNIFAPEIFPQENRRWYDLYTTHFWQTNHGGAGFREFPKSVTDKEFYYDVDSGPVLYGYGFAASAFGIAAARINGRFDQAWPLSLQGIVSSWPLFNGTLLGPRLLSNASDAPYLGEACMLFILTTQPYPGMEIVTGGQRPLYFYVVLSFYFIAALWLGVPLWLRNKKLRKGLLRYSNSAIESAIWIIAAAAIIFNFITARDSLIIYIVTFLLIQVFPRARKVLTIKNNQQGCCCADENEA